MLRIKYISCGSHGFREEDFKGFFSIISLSNLLIPGRGKFEPQEYDLQDFLLERHTKYIRCVPHCFRDEDLLKRFPL